jgi:RNA polymerase sigma-70 factor (ECF subfamily)
MVERDRLGDVPVVRGVEDFERFFRSEYRAVLGLAIVLSGSRSGGEELTQDAFLVTFREWERVGRLENPGAWVRRIVANRAVSRFRRVAAETRALLRLNSQTPDVSRVELEDGLDVWREVRRLPRRQAQVIALTYLDDLSRREVAEILDCGEETVKTHLERARRTLANRLVSPTEGSDGR